MDSSHIGSGKITCSNVHHNETSTSRMAYARGCLQKYNGVFLKAPHAGNQVTARASHELGEITSRQFLLYHVKVMFWIDKVIHWAVAGMLIRIVLRDIVWPCFCAGQ